MTTPFPAISTNSAASFRDAWKAWSPVLLGYPGDNTYANFQEANRALWRQTILPLASRVGASIAQWLGPQFGGELRVVVDTDRIDAPVNRPHGTLGTASPMHRS